MYATENMSGLNLQMKTKCNVHFILKRYCEYFILMLLDIKNLGKQRW